MLMGKVESVPVNLSVSTPPKRIFPADAEISSRKREYVRELIKFWVTIWSTKLGYEEAPANCKIASFDRNPTPMTPSVEVASIPTPNCMLVTFASTVNTTTR